MLLQTANYEDFKTVYSTLNPTGGPVFFYSTEGYFHLVALANADFDTALFYYATFEPETFRAEFPSAIQTNQPLNVS